MKARNAPRAASTGLLICDACGAENPSGSASCGKCGKTRFAPSYVQKLRRVNRNFAVQVTDAHPSSSSKAPRLTLYKWWPGGKATFNINDVAQWNAISSIVELDLAEHLGWKTKKALQEALKADTAGSKTAEEQVRSAVGANPQLITEIAKGLKPDGISQEDLPQIGKAIADIAQILLGADEGLRNAIRDLVAKLPQQGDKAIRELSELMNELTAAQITSIASEVQRRMGLLKLFKERVLDDRTYEIRGDGSIHRLLEGAMWIVDERYWLMHSNAQLRTVVTNELEKKDKKFKTKRPDFVCGAVDNRLIIIEIKRPSRVLEVEDLNQLEQYVVLCEEYETTHRGFEAILVGKKKSDELTRTLKVRGSNLKVKTYTDLVSDTEKRYSAYLSSMKQGQQ